jgi:hypothetical protein
VVSTQSTTHGKGRFFFFFFVFFFFFFVCLFVSGGLVCFAAAVTVRYESCFFNAIEIQPNSLITN